MMRSLTRTDPHDAHSVGGRIGAEILGCAIGVTVVREGAGAFSSIASSLIPRMSHSRAALRQSDGDGAR